MMAAVGVFAVSASGCALDGPNGPEDETRSADPATHCVAPVASDEVHCFSTFRDAIAFATGGAIVDAPEAGVAPADDGFARRINTLAAAPSATVVIGIEFADINFGGSTFIRTATRGCDGNLDTLDFQTADLRASGVNFNDRISSFQSFQNCQTVLFEDINFGGATTQKTANSSNVGIALNDRASSIKWF
jgi:hypothetical protein